MNIDVFSYCARRADEYAQELKRKKESGQPVSDMDSNLECVGPDVVISGARSRLYIVSHVVVEQEGEPPYVQTFCTNVEPTDGMTSDMVRALVDFGLLISSRKKSVK